MQDGGLVVRLELERGLGVGGVDCGELLAVAEQRNEPLLGNDVGYECSLCGSLRELWSRSTHQMRR